VVHASQVLRELGAILEASADARPVRSARSARARR
jgi:hypothetical protein